MPLYVDIAEDRTAFKPGEELRGTVRWDFPQAPRSVELRLFWFTRGKGTEDAVVVERLRFDQPLPAETRPFTFTLPQAPYSFSGKLISLVWAVELVADAPKEVARKEVVVAPGGREVQLESLPPEPGRKRYSWAATGS